MWTVIVSFYLNLDYTLYSIHRASHYNDILTIVWCRLVEQSTYVSYFKFVLYSEFYCKKDHQSSEGLNKKNKQKHKTYFFNFITTIYCFPLQQFLFDSRRRRVNNNLPPMKPTLK